MCMSNFVHLSNTWGLLFKLAKQAEDNVYRDPNTSLIKLRLFAEQMTEAIFTMEKLPYNPLSKQVDKIRKLEKEYVINRELSNIFHTIRKNGNKAAHGNYGNQKVAMSTLRISHFLANWFEEVYGSLEFQAKDFVEPVDVEEKRKKEIEELKAKIDLAESEKEEFKEKLEEFVRQSNNKTDEENRKERRRRSQAFLCKSELNEKETRLMFIDEKLRNAGWEVDTEQLTWGKGARPEKNKNMAISEVPTIGGYTDYALFIGLQLVGVIEAKKYGKAIAGDLLQAKRYAKEIKNSMEYEIEGEYGDYKIPFIYSTNGRPYLKQLSEQSGIWFWDARNPFKPSFALEAFHSPEDLKQKLIVNETQAIKDLEKEAFPDFAERYYQIEAVQAVEKSLRENKRRMLLAMATGTGKTRLALSLMYRLIKTKRVRRVLFLVDRRSLGVQVADTLKDTKINNDAFASLYDIKELSDIMPEETTRIQIATVQGMVKRLFYQDDMGDIPSVGMYDFIIVDEAHRGYTEDREMTEEELLYQNHEDYVSQYRRVIDYFDAAVLGLTATPALHTTEIFGEPIYTYSYKQAIIDGNLIDHDPPFSFETELMAHGIKFESGQDITIWDDENKVIDKAYLEDDLQFDVEQFNKKVITENFNRVILEKLSEYIDPNEAGKTLIFAANEKHAELILRLLKEAYQKSDIKVEDDAISKITGYIDKPNEEIKKFKNEKNPSIVITVDLLTTGIDVPEIVNLVFLRRVRSRILYDQMLGRATRLCPKINKESFKIYDAVHLYDSLKDITDMKPIVKDVKKTIGDVLGSALNSTDEDKFEFFKTELIAKLQRRKQRLSDEEISDIQVLNKIENFNKWLDSLKTMNIIELQKEEQNIIRAANYTKYKNQIAVSDHEDKVTDVIRTYGEHNLKPADYLESFNKFIKENISLIPALHIIATRPKDLTYKDLYDLNLRLKEHNFDEKSLQAAWKQEKKESVLADIISFIRQAALGESLIAHDTRIKQAMQKIYGMEDWTPKQEKWLKRIEKQLLNTPVLAPNAKEYFDETSVWKDSGGYKQAKKVIGEKLDEVIDKINEYLYVS